MRRARPSAAGARLAGAALLALLGGCAGTSAYFHPAPAPAAVASVPLESWPHRELWRGVVFNGEKVGFTHLAVRAAPGARRRTEIESEAAMRLRFLGIDKRIDLRALDRVRPDLTLEAFRYVHEIDGSMLEVEGRADGRRLAFTVRAGGRMEEKVIALDGPLYPASALGLLPLVRGLAVGRTWRVAVFQAETRSIEQAEQEILAYESSELFEGEAFRVRTTLGGLETTSWIAADGRPLLEVAMRGVLVTALEDEATARRHLLEASLARRDTLVDFTLMRAGPIAAPRRVSALAIELANVPENFAVPQAGGQSCRRDGEGLRCRIDRAAAPARDGDPRRYLAPTVAAPSDLREITELAAGIAGDAAAEEEIVSRLLAWIDANIAKEAIDAFSATDVLKSRRAECQGHAYLLAALARARGIPARVVNGIVYSEAHGGFLYHTWNELWIHGGWRPVDATFGQARADATHVKLVEGESPADLLPLARLVGRLEVRSVSALARW